MKKLLFTFLFVLFSTLMSAQKDVTKFLGIPVDGTKTEMKKKLEEKGFIFDSRANCFEGEFNGVDVNVYIVTNNNKVWRIMVGDSKPISETDIKIRFNNLCRQFAKNKRYVQANLNEKEYYIPEDEDISYEMSVHNKRYEAVYCQLPDIDKYASMSPEEQEKAVSAIDMKLVWFMISEHYGEYFIAMYYDNEYNHSDGEDL